VTTRHLWYLLALLLLAPALPARAADRDATGEPLPRGAKVRLGTPGCVVGPRGGFGTYLLAPDFRTYLAAGWAFGRPHVRDVLTGKTTDVPGFDPPERGARERGRTIVAVSADGKRAVTEKDHNTYLVFEIATGKEVGSVMRDIFPGGVALSADGKILALDVMGKDMVRDAIVYNVEKGAQLARMATVKSNFPVGKVLSPDGKTLAVSGTQDRNPILQIWSVETGKLITTSSDDLIGGPVAFSPDCKTLATADASTGAVQLWDAATGKPGAVLLGRAERLHHLAFSPDGKTLAALAGDWKIERWTLADSKSLKPTALPVPNVTPIYTNATGLGLAYADNERVLAWGELWGQIVIWEAPGGKLRTPIDGHLGAVTVVRFTADGKEVVTAGTDRLVYRWDAATGKRTAALTARPHQQQPFTHLAMSPYTHLAPGATRGLRSSSVFDVTSGEELFSLFLQGLTPSDDFRRAAGFRLWARPNTPPVCDVWDLEDRRRVVQLEAPAGFVRDVALAFSPDNARLVAAGPVNDPAMPRQWGMLVTAWDLTTGKRLGEVREPRPNPGGPNERLHLAASGNNSGVVVATADGKLWVADYEKGVRGETLAELTGPQQRFTYPTFSPDGKKFAVGGPTEKHDAYDVRVYDWPRGRLLHTFSGHRGEITALGFSPDGKALASGSADTTVLLWDMGAVPAPK
jgi:WD40 repeat protein